MVYVNKNKSVCIEMVYTELLNVKIYSTGEHPEKKYSQTRYSNSSYIGQSRWCRNGRPIRIRMTSPRQMSGIYGMKQQMMQKISMRNVAPHHTGHRPSMRISSGRMSIGAGKTERPYTSKTWTILSSPTTSEATLAGFMNYLWSNSRRWHEWHLFFLSYTGLLLLIVPYFLA